MPILLRKSRFGVMNIYFTYTNLLNLIELTVASSKRTCGLFNTIYACCQSQIKQKSDKFDSTDDLSDHFFKNAVCEL